MTKYTALDAAKDVDTYLRTIFFHHPDSIKMPIGTNCLADGNFAHAPFCCKPAYFRLSRIPIDDDMHGCRIDLRKKQQSAPAPKSLSQ